MGSSDLNTLIPEEELQATLAEIEKMSPDEAAAIPSLDDDRPDVDATASDQPVAGDPSASLGAPDTSSDEADTASVNADQSAGPERDVGTPEADSAPSPDVDDVPDPPAATSTTKDAAPHSSDAAATDSVGGAEDSLELLDGRQLEAALAEVERMSAKSKAAQSPHQLERDLATQADEDGPADTTKSTEPSNGTDSGEIAGDADDPTEQESAASGAAPSKPRRFKIGERAEPGDVAEYRPPPQREETDAPVDPTRPVAPFAKRVYRALDRVIDALNRPFGALGETGRSVIGSVALVTLLISIMAALLIPLILPHRDGITFLEEKTAQLRSQPAAKKP
jgi:hypothetical protein